jgi:hypothetical protein
MCATLNKREGAFRGLESHEFTMQGIQERLLKRESDVSCLRIHGECDFSRNCERRNNGKFQGVACSAANTSEPHDCERLEQISKMSSCCTRALDHTHQLGRREAIAILCCLIHHKALIWPHQTFVHLLTKYCYLLTEV